MAETRMPRDANGFPVPVLRSAGTPKKLTTVGAAAVAATAFTPGREVVSVICRNAALRYKTGDGTVAADANSDFIEAGERLVLGLGVKTELTLHTHISIIRDGGTDGTLEISELE